MRIRPVEARSDVRGLLEAHSRAWREAYRDVLPDVAIEEVVDPDPEPAHVDQRFSTFRSAGGEAFVADKRDKVVGYAYFRWGAETKPFVGPDDAGLKEIYVDPDHWGTGVGTALLEHGLDRLPDAITALKLEALAENDIGASFYSARGFERTGRDGVEIGGETYPTHIWTLSL